MQVIYIEVTRGCGEADDPVRIVRSWYEPGGRLIHEDDECAMRKP